MPYLGAAVLTLMAVWSAPAKAQELKDLDTKHWAYEATSELQQKGILLGYPDGYFRGKRMLTRYEFAIALKRALDYIMKNGGGKEGAAGPAGPAGPAGANGADGAPGKDGVGVSGEELANLKKLADEFSAELKSLGANVKDINAKLADLTTQVGDLKAAWDKAPKISGTFFVGLRSDLSRGNFVDQSGAFRTKANNSLHSVDAVHDFLLGIKAKLSGEATFTGELDFSNYIAYRGGAMAGGNAAIKPVQSSGETTIPLQARVDTPVGLGSDGHFTVGRFKDHGNSLTFRRPDGDLYFDVPQHDDGNYILDGIMLKTKFGSVDTKIRAGSFASVSTSDFNTFNSPLIGVGQIGTPTTGSVLAGKPYGINVLGNAQQANQTVAVEVGTRFFNLGRVSLGAADYSTASPSSLNTPFQNVAVYNASFDIKPLGRLKINADAAKSVTQKNFSEGDGRDNNGGTAYRASVRYGSGPVNLKVGYLYVDPYYGAPGDWLRLGNWYNPTNVEGATVRLGYKNMYIGANLLTGAKNVPGYILKGDRVSDINAGIDLKLMKVPLNISYEGVFYDLHAVSDGGRSKPVEQYITIGTGLHLSGNTALKLAYQMINFQNIGGGFGAGTGIAGVGDGGNSFNASVFTTQLAVHF